MNRRPLGLKLDKALTGFLQHKAAEALSPNTLIAYEHDLKLWIRYAGDVDVCQVTTQNLRAFLAWLHTDYKPHRPTVRAGLGSPVGLGGRLLARDPSPLPFRLARLSHPGQPLARDHLENVARSQTL